MIHIPQVLVRWAAPQKTWQRAHYVYDHAARSAALHVPSSNLSTDERGRDLLRPTLDKIAYSSNEMFRREEDEVVKHKRESPLI